jgi:hypothetical protein
MSSDNSDKGPEVGVVKADDVRSDDEHTDCLGDAAPAPWLPALLARQFQRDAASATTATLQARCESAARAAYTLARMRRECRRVGFAPVSFADYVQSIAGAVREPLDAVLAWAGLSRSGLQRVDRAAARGIGRLARALDMDFGQALLHANIGFTEGRSPAAASAVMSFRSEGSYGGAADGGEGQFLLRRLRAELTPDQMRELLEIEHDLQEAYNEEAGQGAGRSAAG